MDMAIAWALLIIRVITGVTLIGHGTQKLFGWFGGPGYAKLEQGFKAQGYRPVRLWIALVFLGEVGGGLSLAFGFLTPLGAAGALGAMVMAIKTHWSRGFFNSKGGFEYPLALLAMSVAIGIAGAGAYSFDQLFGTALPPLVFFILASAALIVDVIGILITRTSPATSQPGKAHAA
jgi:putative oxidoreductase